MSKRYQRILITCLAVISTGALYAVAPVVDDSDNFAIIDQHPMADEQPLARESQSEPSHPSRDLDYADEQPLARDSSPPSGGSDNASLLNKIQSLQQDIQELRGQIELQNHEIKVLRDQQLAFYKDLDARLHGPVESQAASKPLTSLEAPAKSSTEAVIPNKNLISASGATSRTNPADEQIRYLAAYDLIKTKRFDEAQTAMQNFTKDYPKGGYTANAHYWLGELSMTQKDYPQAITQFETVLNQFPTSSKSAPSLLKISYALAASGHKQEAISHLKQVIKTYPDTSTAQLAEAKLKSLGR